jgi:hypothetical protein
LILILCNSLFFHQYLNHRRLKASDFWAFFKKDIASKIKLCVDKIPHISNDQMRLWRTFVSSCDNILLCSLRLVFSSFWRLIKLYKVISIRLYMRAAQAMISMRFSFKNCFAFSMRFARVKTKTTSSAIEMIKMIMMLIFE